MKMKGFLFSITAVVLVFSVIALVGSYRIYLSQVEQDRLRAPDIQTQFLYIGSSISRIADIGIRIDNKNSTTTYVNITDHLPRESNYNDSLTAFETFINNNLKSGHEIATNFSSFKNNNLVNFTGINMQYIWGNFSKSNTTIKFSSSGNNSFVKRYDIRLNTTSSVFSGSGVTQYVSGDLPVYITNRSHVLFDSSIDRTVQNNISLDLVNGFTVNLTIGNVQGKNSSLLILPESSSAKISVNISIEINQGEVV